MKPFNLEEALAGNPVVTRSGLPVTQLTVFNASNYKFNVYAVVENEVCTFNKDGLYSSALNQTSYDLFLESEKKSGWINIYPPVYKGYGNRVYGGEIYPTKEEAISKIGGVDVYDTIFIEYEA